MARGDIPTAVKSGNQANKILARTPFEAIPMTIDFTSVSADADGYYKVAAGTPISPAGVPMEDPSETSEGVTTKMEGILLNDVYKDEPAGAILKKAYIDCAMAKASSGCDYDATFVASAVAICPMLVFENVVTA